ncbi:hypothetical protein DPEC_G00154080 [Dallia pectoralis]|uniref:Uncharacterized protein n=1 Tax=Dallia pectoralis TaxID=75939 RepID=A0ACC2GK09_DALPE|nr:hypothetical protein DPEC_G00154080 [Dallia pectoralis]
MKQTHRYIMSAERNTYLFIMLIILPTGVSQVVESQRVVTVNLGGDAQFSCRLMKPRDVLQVTWKKETPAKNVNVATYNERFGVKVNPPFQKKVEFLNVGLQNCSIVIRGVSREDESCYRCLFSTVSGESDSGRICLQVHELYGPTLLVTQWEFRLTRAGSQATAAGDIRKQTTEQEDAELRSLTTQTQVRHLEEESESITARTMDPSADTEVETSFGGVVEERRVRNEGASTTRKRKNNRFFPRHNPCNKQLFT